MAVFGLLGAWVCGDSHKGNGKVLVCVKSSLVGQWLSEFDRWSRLNVVHLAGPSCDRKVIALFETCDVVVVSRAIARHDWPCLKVRALSIRRVRAPRCRPVQKVKWTLLICDEAHGLGKLLRDRLASYPFASILCLTGTPLQKGLDDLFKLLHFANPSVRAHPAFTCRAIRRV